jgi:hypothetical protein
MKRDQKKKELQETIVTARNGFFALRNRRCNQIYNILFG